MKPRNDNTAMEDELLGVSPECSSRYDAAATTDVELKTSVSVAFLDWQVDRRYRQGKT